MRDSAMIGGAKAGRSSLAGTGERRQITALFYDLVGSTELVLRLDLEHVRDLQRLFHEACANELERFGGHLDRVAGDGGSVYFGYPRAQEDAVERAIRCGLAMVEACARLNRGLPAGSPELSVRIGIATGIAVFERSGDGEPRIPDEIVGVAPNLATRLQGIADADTVLVSELTHELAAGLFEYVATGPWALKGFGQLQIAWKVTGARQLPDRLQATRQTLTPIVDREDELAAILSRWGQARAGLGQAMLIVGEPGIGKSRLIAAVRERLRDQECRRLILQCTAYARDSSLHPVIAQLNHWVAQSAANGEASVRSALRDLLKQTDGHTDERVSLLARLLGLPGEEVADGAAGVPGYVREQTLQCLLGLLRNMSADRPLLLVLEDVHWIDPTTEELFKRLIGQINDCPMLLLASSRPDAMPAWAGCAGVELCALERLSAPDSYSLMNQVVGARSLSESARLRIIERTDGIPLFIEEMTEALARRSCAALSDDESSRGIAVNLQDSLSARLDQLGDAKGVAQVASVLGRSFSIGILAEMLGHDPGEVEALAARMVEHGLADRRIRGSVVSFEFRHSLIQEAAYESLLRSRRRELHARAAAALRAAQARGEMVLAEVLAHHCERGGLAEEAIAQLRIAGRLAAKRSANWEASALLERAKALLKGLAPSSMRDRLELDLVAELGSAWIAVQGAGADRVQALYQRGVALSTDLPPSASHFAVLWGWWFTAPNFSEMCGRADQLLDLASKLDDDELRLQGHHCQWATLFHLGEHQRCMEHIGLGLKRCRERSFDAHRVLYGGHDPGVCALGEKALSLWLQGRPESALQAGAESIARAEELGHAGSLIHARDIEVMLHWYRRDPAAVRTSGDKLLTLALDYGLPDIEAKARIMLAWADLQELGDGAAAGRIDAAVESLHTIGTVEDMPVFSDILAEAQHLSGNPARALEVLEQALALGELQGLRYWLAELLRRKAELLAEDKARRPDEWRGVFDRAVKIADEQSAAALALRGLTAWLGCELRLGPEGEGTGELGARLETACGRLAEGRETPDRRAAEKLLKALRAVR